MKFLYLFFILQISIFLNAETKLFIQEIAVKNVKQNGKKWDFFGEAPDLQVEIFHKKSNTWKSIFKSTVYKNVYNIKDLQLKLDFEIKNLKIKIIDQDAMSPDFVGSYEFFFNGNTNEQIASFDSVQKFSYSFKSSDKKKYGKLDSRVQYKLDQAIKSLKNANDTLVRNWPSAKIEAQRSLDSAKRNLEYIKKDYHGKFDEEHPDFVSVVNNTKAMQARVNVFGKSKNETTEKPVVEIDKKNYGKLNSKVQYKLDQAIKSLKNANDTLVRNWPSAKIEAQRSLDSAKRNLEYIKKDYHGQFDEEHPDFVSVVNNIKKMQLKVDLFGKSKNETTEKPLAEIDKKNYGKLNSRVQYKLDQAIKSLKNANDTLVRNWPSAKIEAQRSLDSAKRNLEYIKKDYSGQFDEEHPDFLTVVNNAKKMQAKVDVFGKSKNETTEKPAIKIDKKNNEKLNSKVQYKLEQVIRLLKNANDVLVRNWAGAKNEAQRLVNSAQENLNKIRKDYAGKFDEKHPDFVTVVNNVKKMQTKLDISNQQTKNETNKKPQAETNKKLNSKVQYKLDSIKKTLDSANQTLVRNWSGARKSAQQSVDYAKTNLQHIDRDYSGQFNKQHPDFVAVINRLNKLQGMLDILLKKEEAIQKVQPTLAKIVQENVQRIHKSSKIAYSEIDAKEPNLDRIRNIVVLLNADLPPALDIVADIYKNYPDRKAFKETDLGWKIISGCENIEQMNKNWQTLIVTRINQYSDNVKQNISSANDLKQEALKTNHGITKKVWASQIKQYAQWNNVCIDAIKVLAPNTEAQTKKKVLLDVSKMEKETLALEKFAAKLVNQVVSDEKLKLERARFPKTKYIGSEWKNATEIIFSTCKERFSDSVIKKVTVNSPWNEKRQGQWRGNVWEWNTYKYIGAWVCKKASSGRFLVYSMILRRTKQSNGSWSELRFHSVGTIYEILEENIYK